MQVSANAQSIDPQLRYALRGLERLSVVDRDELLEYVGEKIQAGASYIVLPEGISLDHFPARERAPERESNAPGVDKIDEPTVVGRRAIRLE